MPSKMLLFVTAVLALPLALFVGAQQAAPLPAPAALSAAELPPPGSEMDCDPALVPLWQRIDGRSYPEWTVAWWQWLTALPPDRNPALDPTGQHAGEGQSEELYPLTPGPMYFLAGTFGGGPVVRNITIKSDKYILATPLNVWWDQYPGLWNPLNLPDPLSIQDLRAICAWFTERGIVSCTIDGRQIPALGRYRVKSPVFSMNFHPEFATWYGYTTPYLRTAVSDGTWLILRPLAPGQHVLHLTGEIPDIQFAVDVTYNITVVP